MYFGVHRPRRFYFCLFAWAQQPAAPRPRLRASIELEVEKKRNGWPLCITCAYRNSSGNGNNGAHFRQNNLSAWPLGPAPAIRRALVQTSARQFDRLPGTRLFLSLSFSLHLLMFYYFLFPLPRNTKSARNFVRLCAHVLDIFLRSRITITSEQ